MKRVVINVLRKHARIINIYKSKHHRNKEREEQRRDTNLILTQHETIKFKNNSTINSWSDSNPRINKHTLVFKAKNLIILKKIMIKMILYIWNKRLFIVLLKLKFEIEQIIKNKKINKNARLLTTRFLGLIWCLIIHLH